eukprot:gene35605-43903_t
MMGTVSNLADRCTLAARRFAARLADTCVPRALLQRIATRRVSIALIVSLALAALVTVVLLAFAVLSYNQERDERWRGLHRELDASADQLTAAIALPAWNFDDRQIVAIVKASLNNRDLYGCSVTLSNKMQFVFLRNADGVLEQVAQPPDIPALRTAERQIRMAGREIGVVKMYVTPQYVLQTLRERRIALGFAIVALDVTLVLVLGWFLFKKRISRRQGVAMAISYSGVLLVFGHEVSLAGTHAALGAFLVFFSAFTYALYLTYSGQMVQRLGSLRLAGLASSAACFFCLLQFALLRPWAAAQVAEPVLWLSLLNATACTALPVLLVMMAIERIGPGLTAQTGMIGPMSTIVMGVLILDEPFN